MHDDSAGEIASRIARRKDPPVQIRVLRRVAKIMLGGCVLLYLIGTDTLRERAVMGCLATIMLLGVSYLISWKNNETT